MNYNQAASNGLYVGVGQAAIVRSGGNVTRLATDKVVGCLGVVIKNTATGDMGLIHIMANLSNSDLQEEFDDLIEPTIKKLSGEGQALDVKIFGGSYDDENRLSGQKFHDNIVNKMRSFESVDITTVLTGDVPHPTGVVVDVLRGDVSSGTEMVTNYEEALAQATQKIGKSVAFDSFLRPDVDPLYSGIVYEEPRQGSDIVEGLDKTAEIRARESNSLFDSSVLQQ